MSEGVEESVKQEDVVEVIGVFERSVWEGNKVVKTKNDEADKVSTEACNVIRVGNTVPKSCRHNTDGADSRVDQRTWMSAESNASRRSNES